MGRTQPAWRCGCHGDGTPPPADGVLPGPTGAPTEALGGKGVYGKETACSHIGRLSPLCTDTKVGSMWLQHEVWTAL